MRWPGTSVITSYSIHYTKLYEFFILIGALIFSNFLDAARTPAMLHEWISGLDVAPLVVIGIILLIYLALGCVLESISMMLLTVPLFYPVVTKLGYDPIWFGIIVVVAIEISLITPPIGLNVYMLNSRITSYNVCYTKLLRSDL